MTPTAGRWEVTTEQSTYVIDLDEMWVERVPVDPDAANLRKDGQQIRLLELHRCLVGQAMVMTLELRSDGVHTYRYTTPVRTIREEVRAGQ